MKVVSIVSRHSIAKKLGLQILLSRLNPSTFCLSIQESASVQLAKPLISV
jgi:hypothetical protein